MEHSFTWGGDPEDVLLTVSGEASASEFIAITDELVDDPRHRPGASMIFDYRELDLSSISTATLRALAASIAQRRDRIGPARIAIVFSRAVDFGVYRMFAAFSEGQTSVTGGQFWSLDEARAWLRELSGTPPHDA
jgi:hypothetical protein